MFFRNAGSKGWNPPELKRLLLGTLDGLSVGVAISTHRLRGVHILAVTFVDSQRGGGDDGGLACQCLRGDAGAGSGFGATSEDKHTGNNSHKQYFLHIFNHGLLVFYS